MTADASIQPSLSRSFARIAPATILVQLLSFGSSVVLATQLGASTMTDAYYLALSVPVVVYGVLLAGVRLGGIPALTPIAQRGSSEELGRASSEVVTATLCAAVLVSAAATAVMLVVLPAAADGARHFSSLTRLYIVELGPYAITGAIVGALGAVLAMRGRFAIVTVVLGFEPVCKSILVILVGHRIGAQALVLGNIVGNTLAVAVLWRFAAASGIRLRLVDPRSSPVVRRALRLSAPLVIGQIVLQFNPVIDRTFAAPLGRGSITVLELGLRLFTVPVALLGGAMIAPLAASWSSRMLTDGWPAVTRSFGRIVFIISLVAPTLVVLGILLRHEIVAFAYASHAYTASDVRHTADVFGLLLLGLIPQLLGVPLSTLFIARGDTVFPMKVGLTNCVLNAVLDVLLRGPLGVGGIALSTSITYTILCIVYIRTAQRRWGGLRVLRVAARPLTICAVAATMLGLITAELLARVHPASRISDLAVLLIVAALALVIHPALVYLARAWLGLRSPTSLSFSAGSSRLRRRLGAGLGAGTTR